MKMKVRLISTPIVIIISLFAYFLSACNQEDEVPGMAKIRISMVDAPGDFDSVIIDLEDVYINLSGSGSDWKSMDIVKQGSFDLLKLIGGNDRLLGESTIPEGNFSQIRLVLGSANRLYMGDSAIYLPLPSENRAGLKVEINEYLEKDITYNLILDFDVDHSILRNQNTGDYTLKPIIRGNLENKSGAIKGKINPAGEKYEVYVVRASDTIKTLSNRKGEFLLRALDPGIYDLNVPNDSGIDLTIEEISIRAGEVKDLGDLRML